MEAALSLKHGIDNYLTKLGIMEIIHNLNICYSYKKYDMCRNFSTGKYDLEAIKTQRVSKYQYWYNLGYKDGSSGRISPLYSTKHVVENSKQYDMYFKGYTDGRCDCFIPRLEKIFQFANNKRLETN